MKNAPKLILILLLGIAELQAHAQPDPAFSTPRLRLLDDRLMITYDILNSTPDQVYSIRIEVSNEKGEKLRATALTGDIGDRVSGGPGKSISWDMGADRIEGIPGLYVQVFGKQINPPAVSTPSSSRVPARDISRGGATLRSLAFPGWGLSRINPGSKHWLKGVAGYAALAGAGTSYSRSNHTYRQYQESYDAIERTGLLQKSQNQETTAFILAGTAAAIWISDLVWTIVSSGNRGPLSMGGSIDPLSGTPMLALRIDLHNTSKQIK